MPRPISRKKKPDPASLLWRQWEKTRRQNSRRILVIDAAREEEWTADALETESAKFLPLLSAQAAGTKIAFCLPNGMPWLAFFLALQKLGLAAVPLDPNLPSTACLDLAGRLGCTALFHGGQLHFFSTSRRSRAACIKVTSGTSGGLPKQVSCHAKHLLADGRNIIRTMGLRSRDRNLAAIPLGHSYGLGNLVLPLILQGTPVVCADRFLPRQLTAWINQYRITVFPSVPAIFRVLAALPGDFRLQPLRLAISAGAPLTAEIAQAFFARYRLKIHNFYGSSETGGICYDRAGAATLSGRSVGPPLTGVSVTIQRKFIRVKSAAVAQAGGRWRMPDRGEWNKQGELTLLGRQGREINVGGKKVHPAELEQALRAIGGVTDACVWAQEKTGRALIYAAVETHRPLVEIERELSARLPEWKFPKHYLLKAALPRTDRGKIDQAALRREFGK